jgi:outer membrane lipoprotein SlyB
MESKSLIWIGVFVGSAIGGVIPTLWGDGYLSMSSVILTALGGILGIYVGYKLSN